MESEGIIMMEFVQKGFSFLKVAERVLQIADTENSYEVTDSITTDVSDYSEYGLDSLGRVVGFKGSFVRSLFEDEDDDSKRLSREIIDNRVTRHFARNGKPFVARKFEDKICGVVSKNYNQFDDKNVIDIIGNTIKDTAITGYYISPERFHIRAVDRNNPIHLDGDDSPLYFMYIIDNSMVGRSAFKVQLGVYRQVCSNGLIVPVRECILCKQVHRGNKDIRAEFESNVAFLNKKRENVINILTDCAKETSSIEKLQDEFKKEYLAKKLVVSEAEADKIIYLYDNTYGGKSKWDLVNAITEFARDKSVDKREMLEKRALKVA